MAFQRVAVIMAGGSGERFWPVSTKSRPKQFLNLTDPDRTLLKEAVDRAAALVGGPMTYIATGRHLADRSAEDCPQLPSANILAEPAKRNTTGCLVWVAANLMAQDPEGWPETSMAVLTADHRIAPQEKFHESVSTALDTAERTGGLVTIGIRPDRPETGYGYIELGEPTEGAVRARSFREKPDLVTAEAYLTSGNYLWNSGMFFWTLPAFLSELERARPDAAAKVRSIAGHLKTGDTEAAVADFESLESVSIDYALMEKASAVYVVEAAFEWDDLGAWDSLKRSFDPDPDGNTTLGTVRTIDSADNVVYVDGTGQEVCLLGVEGLVVVVTEGSVLVCPTDRAQEVKRFQSGQ
ncbi:MAG: mannose-1-phosphate guanylyltransferase [Armatimonadetes bacterium]|nr:mannose-1-phosphate guanylyltransferase [Armatimonadota bacterium]